MLATFSFCKAEFGTKTTLRGEFSCGYTPEKMQSMTANDTSRPVTVNASAPRDHMTAIRHGKRSGIACFSRLGFIPIHCSYPIDQEVRLISQTF